MSEFSERFAPGRSINLPVDYESAAERVHRSLDTDGNGFLCTKEVGEASSRSFDVSDQKVRQIIVAASDKLSELSSDRNWFGAKQAGVSVNDLKSVKRVDLLVARGLLSDLTLLLDENAIHQPVGTAAFLKNNLGRIDTDGNSKLTRLEIDTACKSSDKDTSAVATMFHENFVQIANMDGVADPCISVSDVRSLTDALIPKEELLQAYKNARWTEVKNATAAGCLVVANATCAFAALRSGRVHYAIPFAGAALAGLPFVADFAYGGLRSDGGYLMPSRGEISSNQLINTYSSKRASILSWEHFRK